MGLQRWITAGSAGAALAAAAAAGAPAHESGPSEALAAECPRACLEALVADYVDALTANDPSALTLAENVRFTENGVEMEVGAALWRTASGVGSYSHIFADPQMGQVAAYRSIRENGQPAMLALRLKREAGGAISQIEHIVVRSPDAVLRIEDGDYPLPLWTEPVPEAERLSREQLARAANSYFSALENQDGEGVYAFTEDCNRLEVGMYTTNRGGTDFSGEPEPPFAELSIGDYGCREQFETGYFAFDTELHHRRFPVIDVERGVVFAYTFFDHDGKMKRYELADGSVRESRNQLWTWRVSEAFKIERGRIAQIEAWFLETQYHAGSGWDEYDRDYFGIVDAGGIGK